MSLCSINISQQFMRKRGEMQSFRTGDGWDVGMLFTVCFGYF